MDFVVAEIFEVAEMTEEEIRAADFAVGAVMRLIVQGKCVCVFLPF